MTAGWLNEDQFKQLGEWGYSQAAKVFVLEERIPATVAEAPVDYRFVCFDGEPIRIQMDTAPSRITQ